MVRYPAHCAGALAGLFVAAVACVGGEAPQAGVGGASPPRAAESEAAGPPPTGVVPTPESAAPRPPAMPEMLSSPEHQRYQQLRVETLRLMIEAAQRALPIGPFQERIDAAARTALQDVSEAADRMEEIVAELREAIAAAAG